MGECCVDGWKVVKAAWRLGKERAAFELALAKLCPRCACRFGVITLGQDTWPKE